MVTYKDDHTGLTILRAEVSLPQPGFWMPAANAGAADPGPGEVFLSASPEAAMALEGRRMARHKEQQEMARDSWPLNQLGWRLLDYANKHSGKSPQSIDELGTQLDDTTRKQLAANYHLMAELSLHPRQTVEQARVIAFETAPLVDDGKHWVLLSNSQTVRRDIAPEFRQLEGVKIQARHKATPDAANVNYTVLARVLDQKPVTITLKNNQTEKTLELLMDPSKASSGERKVLSEWAQHRLWAMPLASEGLSSAILPNWYRQAPDLYGCDPAALVVDRRSPWQQQRQGRTADIFNVLGGRAAITETLQMQDIDTPAAPQAEPAK